jgi:hypothetical protein
MAVFAGLESHFAPIGRVIAYPECYLVGLGQVCSGVS